MNRSQDIERQLSKDLKNGVNGSILVKPEVAHNKFSGLFKTDSKSNENSKTCIEPVASSNQAKQSVKAQASINTTPLPLAITAQQTTCNSNSRDLQSVAASPSPTLHGKILMAQAFSEFDMISVSYNINCDALRIGEKLGCGSYGQVYKGLYNFSTVAIKQIKIDENLLVGDVVREVMVMANAASPHIVQLYGVSLYKNTYMIVMEYLANGDLRNYLNEQESISWRFIYRISIEVACGLKFLHSKKINYNDLKPENVLLNEGLHAKLTDFGLSKLYTNGRFFGPQAVGSVRYIAPECLEPGGDNSVESDIYSFAWLMWIMKSRRLPYHQYKSERNVRELISLGQREPIEPTTPMVMKGLIESCWAQEPAKRPKLDTIIQELQADEINIKHLHI